jgi:hypothetical protein
VECCNLPFSYFAFEIIRKTENCVSLDPGCDNLLQHGGGPAPDGNSGCNMPCSGNSTEVCIYLWLLALSSRLAMGH